MSIERNTLETRAAVHAALSEPHRLAIVDALTLGDVSPTELQHALDVPSNLLAHHLRVLEDAGLVARSRSEADRRRTYLRLVRSQLDGLIPTSVERAKRVIFVCTANSARSHLAAALWQSRSTIPASSAGTHPATEMAPGARAVAQRHRLSMPSNHPRAFDDVLEANDFVITVCDLAHEELGDAGRLHWSVPDPVPVGTADAFDAAFAELERRVSEVAPRLAAS